MQRLPDEPRIGVFGSQPNQALQSQKIAEAVQRQFLDQLLAFPASQLPGLDLQ
jgi:hypothetical protein